MSKILFNRVLTLALLLCMLCTGVMAEVTYPIQTDDNELSFWLPIQPIASKYMGSYNEHMIYGLISENTGMKVDFQNCSPADAATQLGLVIVSEDLPDIMQIRGLYPGGASTGVSEGIFLDLTDYLPEYAPDYWAAIRSSDLCWRLATDENGRVSAFYTVKITAPAFVRLNVLQEMLDEHSLAVPQTLAEYETIFANLKEKGIYGMHLNANGRSEMLMWPFGITNGWGLDETGKVEFGMYTEAYREYLTMMNDWYTKGYIYKDFMSTMSDAERRALLTNKVVFMLQEPVDLAHSACFASGLTSVPLPYVRKELGQSLHFESTYNTYVPETNFATTVITKDCDNVEEAVMYLNYCYTQEGADLCNWGVKDVHYTVDANGVKHFTDVMLNNPDMPLGDVQMNYKIHMQAKLSEADVVCNPNVVSNEESLAKRMLYSDDPTIDNAQVLPSFSFTAEASEERSNIMSDINTYVDEMTLKFITGVTPLSEFDNYMAQLKAMGIEDAIAITQQQYDAFMSKPGLE